MRTRCAPLEVHEPIAIAELEARIRAACASISPAARCELPPLARDYFDVLGATTWYGHQIDPDCVLLAPRAVAERAEAATAAHHGQARRGSALWIALLDAAPAHQRYLCVDRDSPLFGRVASSRFGDHPCWTDEDLLDLGTFESWLTQLLDLRRGGARGVGCLLRLTPEDLVELDPVLATGDPWALVVAARDLQYRTMPDRTPPPPTCAPDRVLLIHHPPLIDDLVVARFEDTSVAIVPANAMSRFERLGPYTAWSAADAPSLVHDVRDRMQGSWLFVGNFTLGTKRALLDHLLSEAPASSRLRACEASIEQAVAIEAVVTPAASPIESAFGGEPYTPEDFVWPVAPDGRAMAFIAQVNFAEASPYASPELIVPRAGLLQLFCAAFYTPGPAPDAGMRLVWHPRPDDARHRAQRAPQPAGVRAAMRFRPTWSAPDLSALLPEHWLLDYAERGIDRRLPEAEFEARRAYADRTRYLGSHQLFGRAGAIQYDPRFSMAWLHGHADLLAAWTTWYADHRTLLAFDDAGQVRDDDLVALWQLWMQTDAARGFAAECDGWRLLWQIDTDEALGLTWGDLGRLFVMIRREDLAANKLFRARIQWQAH
ncbi:MAG TPA: YwqG family protein [Kofleriaceae bacterium]|nr:YwqG family protein [Kofleriaceae bacterium]